MLRIKDSRGCLKLTAMFKRYVCLNSRYIINYVFNHLELKDPMLPISHHQREDALKLTLNQQILVVLVIILLHVVPQ